MADSLVNKIVMVDSAGVLRWLDKDSLITPVYACWDINENGIQDSTEDVNGDGFWNGLDCGTDDQIITNFALNGNNLTLTIENGNTVNVDLSQYLDNTDDQNLTGAVLDPNTNILTISIENGTPVSVDLSSLVGSAGVTADNGLTLINNNIQWGGSLLHNTQVSMNNYNVLFSGQGATYLNTMSLGGVNSTRAKFNVQSNAKNYGTYVRVNDSQVTNGPFTTGEKIEVTATRTVIGSDISVDASGYTGGNPLFGQKISLVGGTTQFNYGSEIYVSSTQHSQVNRGISVHASGNTDETVGVEAFANGGNSNNAGLFSASGTASGANTGVAGSSSGSTTKNVGVFGNVNADGDNVNVGVQGFMYDPNTFSTNGGYANYAGRFMSSQPPSGTNTNYGVYGQAIGGQTGSHITGVSGYATGGGTITGGSFSAAASVSSGYTADAIYGVYASVNPTGTNTAYAGYFNGDVYISGTYGPSDQNMKTNITNYDSSLYVINQLQPKTFEFTDANFPGMVLPTGHQYGLIAQEVEQILPDIVSDNTHPAEYDSLGNQIHPAYNFKGLDYEAFIPILIGGVKEQQAIINTQDSTIAVQDSLINDLNDRLTTLESCLSNLLPILCQMNQSAVIQNSEQTQQQMRTMLNVELTDAQNIVLEQNIPNPFAEQTIINYTIPTTVQKAQILFYNQSGQLIKAVDITERGNGQINVFGSDLSTGAYTYSLVVDGQVVATKRMVKVN